MKNELLEPELFFFRSIRNHFREKFLKPWREFREWVLVFAERAKNTSEDAPFLLVHFLWASKENEQMTSQTIVLDCARIDNAPKSKTS